MSNQLKLYPSGFLGSNQVKQTQQLDMIDAAKAILNTASIGKASIYTTSVTVNDLWSKTISGSKECSSFDFKEQVLKCAFEVFGEEFLVDWLNAQYQSSTYSDNHSRWIDETLNYIYNGSNRDLSFNNWTILLESGSSSIVNKNHSVTVKKHLFNSGILTSRGNITIKQFILHWVRQRNGINDLLSSMYVLYGKH